MKGFQVVAVQSSMPSGFASIATRDELQIWVVQLTSSELGSLASSARREFDVGDALGRVEDGELRLAHAPVV